MMAKNNPAPSYRKLEQAEIDAALESLPGWTAGADGKSITRSFRFRSFVEAFGFMTEMALVAEKLNHHPEWFNVYGRVEVMLTTHAASGLTDLDITFAKRMSQAADRRAGAGI